VSAFKAVLFALLAANAVWFALGPSPSKAIDACAWLVLLALFVAETDFGHLLEAGRSRMLVRAARLVAGIGVVAATIGYVFEDNLLDTVNCVVWIAVVILLETELRFPALAARASDAFRVTALALYGSLGVLVILWAVQGMWIDAYDAVLWLIAFGTIELSVSRRTAQAAGAQA
jgi:hypothetical protein